MHIKCLQGLLSLPRGPDCTKFLLPAYNTREAYDKLGRMASNGFETRFCSTIEPPRRRLRVAR
jgi:hypothetical protein